jgi:DNA-directed RNA polymerase specialized sigma24 family protein
MPIMTANLARREREVVTLICEEGLSNKEAAWRLGIPSQRKDSPGQRLSELGMGVATEK